MELAHPLKTPVEQLPSVTLESRDWINDEADDELSASLWKAVSNIASSQPPALALQCVSHDSPKAAIDHEPVGGGCEGGGGEGEGGGGDGECGGEGGGGDGDAGGGEGGGGDGEGSGGGGEASMQ